MHGVTSGQAVVAERSPRLEALAHMREPHHVFWQTQLARDGRQQHVHVVGRVNSVDGVRVSVAHEQLETLQNRIEGNQ